MIVPHPAEIVKQGIFAPVFNAVACKTIKSRRGTIMKCIKCNKSIPDGSIYCNFCGKKQTAQKKKKSRSRKGRGSVTYRKDKKKYWARITSEDNKRTHIGYYASETEAWNAIDKFLTESITDNFNWTVTDCYNKWSESHYPTITKSGAASYKNAWKYFASIKNMKMRDVKTSHLQKCVDSGAEKFSRPICEKIKTLASQLCKYAMQEDLINKNYAQFLKLPAAQESETNPFSDEDIKILLKNDTDDTVKIILILIYTGFRPTEFFNLEVKNIDTEKWFIRGGGKTEAGRNRIVPIAPKIQNYVNYFYTKAKLKGQKYLIVNSRGNKFDINNFRNRYFYKTLEQLEILEDENDRHLTPYSTRHTFATLCDRADIDDNLLIKMIGHTTKKTTDRFYIHKTEEDMKKAVEVL